MATRGERIAYWGWVHDGDDLESNIAFWGWTPSVPVTPYYLLLEASSAAVATVVRGAGAIRSAASAATTSLVRNASAIRAATSAATGSLVRDVTTALSGTASAVGSLVRGTTFSLGSATSAAIGSLIRGTSVSWSAWQAGYNFGETTVLTLDGYRAANRKHAQLQTLPLNGRITGLVAYMDGGGTGTGNAYFRPSVFSDSASNPDALLSDANEAGVLITDTATYSWVSFPFATPVVVSAGNYWLSLHGDNNGDSCRIRGESTGGTVAWNDDNYSDGTTDPFGTHTDSSARYSLYAEYEVSSIPISIPVVTITTSYILARLLEATGAAVATVIRGASATRSAASAGSASLVRGASAIRSTTSAAIGSLIRATSATRSATSAAVVAIGFFYGTLETITLAAVSAAVGTVTMATTWVRTLAVTSAAVATLVRAASATRSATSAAVATLISGLSGKVLEATSATSATLVRSVSSIRSAVSAAVATITTSVGYQSVVSAIYGTAHLIQNTGDAILVQCLKAAELIQTTGRAILRERK